MNTNSPVFSNDQRGAVLVISLLMLMIMTILALSISQTSTLQERMVGNERDLNVALQASEAGLRAAERALKAVQGTVILGPDLTNYLSRDINAYTPEFFADRTQSGNSWWSSAGIEYGAVGTHEITSATQDPRYVIQLRGRVCSDDSFGCTGSGSTTTWYYEITSYATGVSGDAEVITQSTYLKQ